MKRFDEFKKSYEESIEVIRRMMLDKDGKPPMDELVKWLLETDANPYFFLEEKWANGFDTAEGFLPRVGGFDPHRADHFFIKNGCVTQW